MDADVGVMDADVGVGVMDADVGVMVWVLEIKNTIKVYWLNPFHISVHHCTVLLLPNDIK